MTCERVREVTFEMRESLLKQSTRRALAGRVHRTDNAMRQTAKRQSEHARNINQRQSLYYAHTTQTIDPQLYAPPHHLACEAPES